MGQRGLDMPGRTQVVVVRPDLSLGLWGVCVYRRGAVSSQNASLRGGGCALHCCVPFVPSPEQGPHAEGAALKEGMKGSHC